MDVIVSAAVSLDGYLDDCSADRLKLSGDRDWESVLRLRAECDAILVGAGTLRKDNPSLVIRDPELRRRRTLQGMPEDITKVTLTASGRLDPGLAFFTEGAGGKIVFAPLSADDEGLQAFSDAAEVVRGENITAASICAALAARGCKRLMVEGGTQILTMFFAEDAVDRLRLAVAPFFVGEGGAPRFVAPALFPWNKSRRMELERVEMLDDMAVMYYKMDRV